MTYQAEDIMQEAFVAAPFCRSLADHWRRRSGERCPLTFLDGSMIYHPPWAHRPVKRR
jgi:hypothetical protein